MGKICPNKHTEAEYAATPVMPGDKRCGICGAELVDTPKPKEKGAPKNYLDNRQHIGDKHVVEGDSISAENIDNRVITDNSLVNNTTINNITTVVKHEKYCEISGDLLEDGQSKRCPKCKRLVSVMYYVESEMMCRECNRERQIISSVGGFSGSRSGATNASGVKTNPVEQKAYIPAMSGQGVTAAQPIVEPIGTSGGSVGNKRWRYAIVGLIGLAVVVTGVFALTKSSVDNVRPSTETTAVEVSRTAEQDAAISAKQTANTSSKNTAGQFGSDKTSGSKMEASTTTTAKQQIASNVTPPPVVTPTPSKATPFEEGKKAYDAGNFTKANLLFMQAADNGDTRGCYYLAKMYQKGSGVSRSAKDAFANMLKAANAGYDEAFFELAEMYRTGVGTEANRTNAKGWYEKATLSSASTSDKAAAALSKYY